MSSRNYATALTHALLAGTSIWCISKINGSDRLKYATGSFGVIAVNSLIGVWKYGNPEYGQKADGMYDITQFCAKLFAVAGIATNIYLNYGVEWHYSIIHLAIPSIPLLTYILDEHIDRAFIDLTALGDTISLGFMSFQHTNHNGMYAAVCYLINYFIFDQKDIADVPRDVMYNLGMCFYTMFAYHAVLDAHVRIH